MKSSQSLSSPSWSRPSCTKVLASMGVPTSRRRGPCVLPRFNVFIRQETRRILTLDCREGFWDSIFEMDLACSFWSTLLTLTEWAMTVNRWPWTRSLPAMTVVHVVSCSRRAFVAGVSAVTRTSPLFRVLAAMTLPGFPALALLMASTTRMLGCSGAALLVLFTVTSLRSLPGTNFSIGTGAAGGEF